MSDKKQLRREYQVYDKLVHLDLLCRELPIDNVDLSGLYITENDEFLAHLAGKNISLGCHLKDYLCEFNQWSSNIQSKFIYDSAAFIRKYVYAAIAKVEENEEEKKQVIMVAYRETLNEFLRQSSFPTLYHTRSNDVFSEYIDYQFYFILGHEVTHFIMNTNPTIKKQLLDQDKQMLKENFVDPQNTMLHLLEKNRLIEEISCDCLSAHVVMKLFSKMEKSHEKIIDCAMSIMMAVMSLKLPDTSENLVYVTESSREKNYSDLSDLRIFPVNYYIVHYLSDVYSQDVAESFKKKFQNYYNRYRVIHNFVKNELHFEVDSMSKNWVQPKV